MTEKPTLTKEEQITFITKWIYKIFGESFKYDFDLGFSEEDLYVNGERAGACVGWNHVKKRYYIDISSLATKQILMHELGHIYLEHKLGFDSMRMKKSPKGNVEILLFINSFLDCFTDYNLVLDFPEYYPEFVKGIDNDLQYLVTPETPFFDSLLFYLQFYLQLNFILNYQDKITRINNIKQVLKQERKAIIEKSNGKLCYQNIQQWDKQLDKFREIKDTKNFKLFFSFIWDTLVLLKLWSKSYLKEQLNLFLVLK